MHFLHCILLHKLLRAIDTSQQLLFIIMAEDSISNDDDASEMGAECWGVRLSKSIASLFAHHSTSPTSTNSTSTMMDIQQQPPPPPIIDVQIPVPAEPPSTNAAKNNEWLHFCIMALLEGKYGKNSISSSLFISCAYLMHFTPNSCIFIS